MEYKHLVSVIIPSYNRAEYLPDAIGSIVAQGIDGVQVVLVDDGSTDHTRQVAESYCGLVTYAYQENQGPGPARNLGLRLATGKYVAFLDSDDVWLPGKLARELSFFEQQPELDAIISDAEFWRDGKLELPSRFGVSVMSPMPVRPTMFRWESRGWAYGGGVCATCCMILRQRVLHQMGLPYFEPSISSYEDWAFEMKVYHHGKVLINPEIVAQVRRFRDETRPAAPLPGSEAHCREQHLHTSNQLVAMRKFLQLEDLPPFARALGELRCREFQKQATELAAQFKERIYP